MASGVYVSDVEDGDGSFDVVHNFEHFFEAAPEFLPSRGFDPDL